MVMRFVERGYAVVSIGYRLAPAHTFPAQIHDCKAAIRWILDHPGAHTICMGAKNIDDYRSAIAAAEMMPLDPAVYAKLKRMTASL